VLAGGDAVGFFTGLVFKRYGLRLLGSPFPGWTTSSMGFNVRDDATRAAAARALPRFAFGELGCVHLELKDRRLTADDLDFPQTPTVLYEIDLALPEQAIFDRMTSACRRAIRKSEKEHVVVEEAEPDGFADEYYAQLVDVFEKQGLTPTYGVERVRDLIRFVHPTGRLMLVRARNPEGRPIATAIFPAHNGTAYFWGGASRREDQILRPNEAVFWFAMRRLRDRGIRVLDLGGGGEYKLKYGPVESSVPWFRRSRYPGLEPLRQIARRTLARV
jgi:hypothetical protein